jgi:SAM-dependent methyltransferase
VLDFGCGIGRIALWLAPRVASVHGVDGYREMLERARREIAATAVRNVVVCPYDGARLPFRAGAFDRTTSVWVLQHITDDAELAIVLGELARTTRRGGIMAFIERVSEETEEAWMPPGTIARRRVDAYPALFADAGLRTRVATPICDAGPIWHGRRVDRLVLGGRIPSRIFGLIAWVDLFVRQRRTVGNWADHLFVCERT